MFFIIPKNYNLKPKLLGLFDYSTAILNIIIFFAIILFSNLYNPNIIKIKLFIVITFYFPFFLFSLVGFNHESFIYVLYYIIKFIYNRKFYLYNKN